MGCWKKARRWSGERLAEWHIDLTRYSAWILLLTSLLSLGSYWAYDIPGAIQTQLTMWFGGPFFYTDQMNLTLYSVYSYPNIVLAFCGGIIIDKWTGIAKGTVLFVGLVFLGQVIFSLGIEGRCYIVALVGRFILGLGGESITVAQSSWASRWFKSSNSLALAFGITVSLARVGSALSFITSPLIVEDTSVPVAVWVATTLCGVSLIASIALGISDWWGLSSGRLELPEQSERHSVSLRQILRFPLAVWLLCFTCMFFYMALIPLYAVASQIIQSSGTVRYDPEDASSFVAIPNVMAIVLVPLFGKIVDIWGWALVAMVFASAFLILGDVMFLGTALEWWTIFPVYTFLVIGLGYCIFAAALWPLIIHVARKNALSTAYGLMSSLQAAGVAVTAQIVGAIQISSPGDDAQFVGPLSFFIGSSLVSGLLSLFLIYWDKKTLGILNLSADQRNKRILLIDDDDDDIYEEEQQQQQQQQQ